jgi:hypothetical protein
VSALVRLNGLGHGPKAEEPVEEEAVEEASEAV